MLLLSIIIFCAACNSTTEQRTLKKLHLFAHQMPKTSLHIHLEGSIPPPIILKLAKRNNVVLPFKTEPEFHALCHFSNFQQFVDLYKLITSCFKTPEDYELIAYEFGRECARQNIRYAEVTFTIDTNCKFSGLPWQTILAALNKGKARAQKEFHIIWNWIFDLTRSTSIEPENFVDLILEARASEQDVVAMGLSENILTNYPNVYKHALEKALQNNLPIIPHAGEFEGPPSIWNALNICKALRIGHGVRCIEDKKLMHTLRQQQTPLDICITSNVCLGVVPNYQQHPLRKLWNAGLFITISADDPPFFNCDLNQEYDHLIDDYHFSIDELEQVSINGLTASLLPQDCKKELIQTFKTTFALLRKKIF
jgi:adenosine deaminase